MARQRGFTLPTNGKQIMYTENATLPVISAAGFAARVNCYVVGGAHTCVDGETDLWYVSLVGQYGQAATLRAIVANAVVLKESRSRAIVESPRLQGVGLVALGHHRKDLCGVIAQEEEEQRQLLRPLHWRMHWTYFQENVAGGRDIHGILESPELTYWDPVLWRDRPACSQEELCAQQHTPLFLLLLRKEEATNPRRLALLHLKFLSTRILPLPFYPPWAPYLWERALQEGEATPLTVWCYDPAEASKEGEQEAGTGGAQVDPAMPNHKIHAAYLCQPDPLALVRDLGRAIRCGFHATQMAQVKAIEAEEAERAMRLLEEERLREAARAAQSVPVGEDMLIKCKYPESWAERIRALLQCWQHTPAPVRRFLLLIFEIVEAADGVVPFIQTGEDFWLRVPNEPYEPLTIEAHGRRYLTVTHYYEQNGDLIPDPDVEIDFSGKVLTFTQVMPTGPMRLEPNSVQDAEGEPMHISLGGFAPCERVLSELTAHEQRDIEDFLGMWATNLREQGFVEAASMVSILEPVDQESREAETGPMRAEASVGGE